MNIYLIIFIIFLFIILTIINIDYEQFNIWLLNKLLVLRGILTPNCNWYAISDILLKNDAAGIKLYNYYKKKYGDFAPTYMFGKKINVVTNNKYIKIILDNSPNLFSVGELKITFFKSFMAKNVGVSKGCPWKRRRYINEMALVSDRLHIYSNKYNNDIINQVIRWKYKKVIQYQDFLNLGKKMVAKIVFNTENISDDIFKIFSEANSIKVFSNSKFKLNKNLYNNYIKTLNYYINNPRPKSLVDICMKLTNDKEEVLHQIPHFIFPIVGIFATVVPRLLLLLCNHKKVFSKLLQEINSMNDYNINNYEEIYKLTYLRKCVLETLRLNNSVVTTFRTLEKNYTFDNKYNFKKGEQFLILNYPVLREKDFFKEPNKFIPSRWNSEMEKSYYAISFNQGPQKCPGKELAIYLAQNFVYNLIKIKNIGEKEMITSHKINIKEIPQILNPCKIKFYFNKL